MPKGLCAICKIKNNCETYKQSLPTLRIVTCKDFIGKEGVKNDSKYKYRKRVSTRKRK